MPTLGKIYKRFHKQLDQEKEQKRLAQVQMEKARKLNRQKLLELINIDPFYSDSIMQTFFKELCFDLFDASDSVFSRYQLDTLLQIMLFALNYRIEILSVKTQGEFETTFDTLTHSLKVIYTYDEYETHLTDKETKKTEIKKGLYFTDFSLIMEEIKRKLLATNQHSIL